MLGLFLTLGRLLFKLLNRRGAKNKPVFHAIVDDNRPYHTLIQLMIQPHLITLALVSHFEKNPVKSQNLSFPTQPPHSIRNINSAAISQ